jgi:hypothetical protein
MSDSIAVIVFYAMSVMKYQENNINIPSRLALKFLNRSEAEVGLVIDVGMG